jgi:8-oxo-dGTP pyrophosphatase MutT (NUDIX family)
VSERLDSRITVAALIERDGRFLMVEERDGPAVVYNQPAGHLEADETLTQAIVREVREETGHTCRPEHIVGVYLWPSRAGPTILRVAFACRTQGEGRGPSDPDILALHWLTRAELGHKSLRSPLVTRCADDYLAGRRYPLELLCELPRA